MVSIELEEKILRADLAQQVANADPDRGHHPGGGWNEILNQLIQQQKDVVENSKEDVGRIATLRNAGLNTESDLSRARDNASAETGAASRTFAALARSRQEMSELKLQLAS